MNRMSYPQIFAPMSGPYGAAGEGGDYYDEGGYVGEDDDDPQAALERAAYDVAAMRAGQPGTMSEDDGFDELFAPIGTQEGAQGYQGGAQGYQDIMSYGGQPSYMRRR